MITDTDRENVTKSAQAVNLLLGDLNELLKTNDPELKRLAEHVIINAVQLEQKLISIEAIAGK